MNEWQIDNSIMYLNIYIFNLCKYAFIDIIILSTGTKVLHKEGMLFKKLSSSDVENETLRLYCENTQQNKTNS